MNFDFMYWRAAPEENAEYVTKRALETSSFLLSAKNDERPHIARALFVLN